MFTQTRTSSFEVHHALSGGPREEGSGENTGDFHVAGMDVGDVLEAPSGCEGTSLHPAGGAFVREPGVEDRGCGGEAAGSGSQGGDAVGSGFDPFSTIGLLPVPGRGGRTPSRVLTR
jgi:hypothetical protein